MTPAWCGWRGRILYRLIDASPEPRILTSSKYISRSLWLETLPCQMMHFLMAVFVEVAACCKHVGHIQESIFARDVKWEFSTIRFEVSSEKKISLKMIDCYFLNYSLQDSSISLVTAVWLKRDEKERIQTAYFRWNEKSLTYIWWKTSILYSWFCCTHR